jgi:hypothetical protein
MQYSDVLDETLVNDVFIRDYYINGNPVYTLTKYSIDINQFSSCVRSRLVYTLFYLDDVWYCGSTIFLKKFKVLLASN